MVVLEEDACKQEFYIPICEDTDERVLESQLLQNIRAHELVGDDKVIPGFVSIPVQIGAKLFGLERRGTVAAECFGFDDEPMLAELDEDMEKLSHN